MPPGAEQAASASWWIDLLSDPRWVIMAALALAAVIVAIVRAWYGRREYLLKLAQAKAASQPLGWHDADKLRAEGLIRPHPEYVDRGIDREGLCREHKLAFVGPPKIGKTREAVWTALALYNHAPSRRAIFVARPPLEVPTTVPEPYVDQAIVIVDDIASRGRPERPREELPLPTVLDNLASLEEWLERHYRDGWWLILTSRLEQWRELADGRPGAVLRTYKRIELHGIEGEPEEQYVHRVCELVGWDPPGETLTRRFAQLNDGTFLSLYDFLLPLKQRHANRADLTEADAEAFRQRRDTAWEQERAHLPQRQCELLDALALLREIGAPLYGPLAVEMRCGPPAFRERRRYRRALEALCRTWLRQEPGGIVSTHDSRLERDEPVADEEVATLARLLLRFSRRRRHRAASPPLLAAAYTALEEPCRRNPSLYPLRLRVAHRRLELMPDDPGAALAAGNAELALGLVRDAARHIPRAVALYRRALGRWTEQDAPRDWAMTRNNLGIAWRNLPTGDRGENLQRAIACYEAALRVYTERDYPADWAATQNNLGNAWSDLPTGDRGENVQRAIWYFEAALRVYTERDYPAQWAMTQNNLGTAWGGLPTGDRGENLQRAIGYFEAALRVHTERHYPADWAMTQNNLGIAWRNLPTGDRGGNLQRAIACYEAALRVYTERDYPADWATTQFNLALLFEEVPSGHAAQDLARALSHAENARRGFQGAGMPRDVDDAKRLIARLKGKLDDCSEQAKSLPG